MGYEGLWQLISIGCFGCFVGITGGVFFSNYLARLKQGSAQRTAEKIKNDAEREAEHLLRDARVSAKAETIKMREECEAELKERRREQTGVEKRLAQREELLDRRTETLDEKIRGAEKQEHEAQLLRERLSSREQELAKNISRQIDELERISGYSRDEAREVRLEKLGNEVRNESGIQVRNILEEAKAKSEREARRILTYAIQRYASDCTYERTTATIPLPNDELKGRIIGREGRNIRALEAATGVEVVVDDTPEAIVLSCFDPVRREVARLALHQLVLDGRIHPARIEEVVAKVRKQLEEEIIETGKRTCIDMGVHGLHPELIRMIGKMKYRSSYGQNLLQHARETANLCAIMAAELGLNVKKARRAGLLHDIGKVPDDEPELPHALLGAKIAEEYKEKADIVNAIAAHHEECEMTSIIAPIVQICDAISGARPGARREIVEAYIKRLNDLENLAQSYPGVVKSYAIQAGRELRVIVGADKISDAESEKLSADIARKIQTEMTYPGQVKITVIRETRSVAYAK